MEKETQIRRLVVHDLPPDAVCADANTDVAADDGNLHPCIGCFGCWIKTPGQCVLHDGWEHMGWRIAQCEELVLVSRCVYGSVSPFVKNVLDRSIPYLHPDFARVEGQMHHKQRYAERRALRVLFYGDVPAAEQQTACRWAAAMALNMDMTVKQVTFLPAAPEGRDWL